MSYPLKVVFYWSIMSLALLALAGPYPDVATGLVVLVIFAVIVTHADVYAKFLTPPQRS